MKILKLINTTNDNAAIIVVVVPHTEQPERFGTVHMISKDIQELKIGDKVVFGQYGGTDLAIPGDVIYKVMRLADIYGTVEF